MQCIATAGTTRCVCKAGRRAGRTPDAGRAPATCFSGVAPMALWVRGVRAHPVTYTDTRQPLCRGTMIADARRGSRDQVQTCGRGGCPLSHLWKVSCIGSAGAAAGRGRSRCRAGWAARRRNVSGARRAGAGRRMQRGVRRQAGPFAAHLQRVGVARAVAAVNAPRHACRLL